MEAMVEGWKDEAGYYINVRRLLCVVNAIPWWAAVIIICIKVAVNESSRCAMPMVCCVGALALVLAEPQLLVVMLQSKGCNLVDFDNLKSEERCAKVECYSADNVELPVEAARDRDVS